jgi:glyoxylase-like metal-dependent hydrolase (beta-lactamase superfamily II)
VRELAPGIWHWQAKHPQWEDTEPWDPSVSSYAIDDGERLLLVDPLGTPGGLVERVADRDTAIVLTAPWHERDTRSLVDRLGLPIYSPRPESAQDLMDKYGITAEQAGDGSPDLAWLRSRADVEVHWYSGGDRLPFSADVFPGREPNDVVLLFEQQRTVISGDTLVDFGQGLEISPRWLREAVTREMVVEQLRPLLDRQVELVLPTHGAPTDRAALERALS